MFVLKKKSISGSSYPYKIETVTVMKSLSYLKVLNVLKTLLSNTSEGTFFLLEDSENTFLEIYDQKGSLIHRNSVLESDVFSGNDCPKFRLGDIVQVKSSNSLKLGVITGVPLTTSEVKTKNLKLDQSDNVYLVDYSSDTSNHDHPYEWQISYPKYSFSPEEKNKLKEAYKEIMGDKHSLLSSLKFGDYIRIEQKRFGVPNELYLYKVINTFRSNSYKEVPVVGHFGEEVLKKMEEVVSCICCGVQEKTVEVFRIKDVERVVN